MNRDELRGWLHKHTPIDQHEERCLTQVISALGIPGDCFSKLCFEPGHITASAFVLSPDQQQMLLISHRDFGQWMQPGGHLDPKDIDTFNAAKRELAEEAGLTDLVQPDWAQGILDVDVHNVPAGMKRNEPAHKHFDIRFAFSAISLQVQAASDAKDARWFSIEHLVRDPATDASVRRAPVRIQTLAPTQA